MVRNILPLLLLAWTITAREFHHIESPNVVTWTAEEAEDGSLDTLEAEAVVEEPNIDEGSEAKTKKAKTKIAKTNNTETGDAGFFMPYRRFSLLDSSQKSDSDPEGKKRGQLDVPEPSMEKENFSPDEQRQYEPENDATSMVEKTQDDHSVDNVDEASLDITRGEEVTRGQEVTRDEEVTRGEEVTRDEEVSRGEEVTRGQEVRLAGVKIASSVEGRVVEGEIQTGETEIETKTSSKTEMENQETETAAKTVTETQNETETEAETRIETVTDSTLDMETETEKAVETEPEVATEVTTDGGEGSGGAAVDDMIYSSFPASPAATRRMFDHPPGQETVEIARRGRKMLGRGEQSAVCEPRPSCPEGAQYRSYDGTCNSLTSPLRGARNSPYVRFVSPAYGDGVFLPRGVSSPPSPISGYTSSLPSPRKISDTIMKEGVQEEDESERNTHMVMQWGQLVDHDIVSTSKDVFDCCNPQIRNLPRCFPIPVPASDSFFSEFGRDCLDFTRSDVHCRGGPAWGEQFNKQTAFLDGSVIYGCHEDLALKLRGGSKAAEGRLLANSQLPHFLPSAFDVKLKRSAMDKATDFVAGDDRVESQASLTALQNLFFNEHNRIAGQLFQSLKGKLGETELDEFVYQETRRLVSASLQHITYTEFLPAVLGDAEMAKHELDHEDCQYSSDTDPGILNSFAAAAFRFGHSLVQSIFRGANQPWRLGKFYADSRFAFKDHGHGYVNELQGLSTQPCMKADLHMTSQVSQQLFCNNASAPGSGHDLVSINIQRGRDHGIPGYNKLREKCGLPPLTGMEDRPAEINEENWSKLGSVYSSVEEVDLYVGGLAETPLPGGLVGPTFSCIIGGQFRALMDGDRYFYRHTAGPGIRPLTGVCLEQVKQRRLSDIICENTDIQDIQENVFIQAGPANPPLPCSSHRTLDLAAIVSHLETNLP